MLIVIVNVTVNSCLTLISNEETDYSSLTGGDMLFQHFEAAYQVECHIFTIVLIQKRSSRYTDASFLLVS